STSAAPASFVAGRRWAGAALTLPRSRTDSCDPMLRHVSWLAVIAIGCADPERRCGEGTTEIRGVCEAASPTVCGDGTRLDNGQCVVDPAACQAGTVLIGHRCLDPTSGLVVDLEESPEPNGLRVAP